MSLEGFAAVLKKLIRSNPEIAKKLAESNALLLWEEAVGAQIAKQSKAVKIEHSKLYVQVSHPIWKNEIQIRKKQILEKFLDLHRKTYPQYKIELNEIYLY